MALVTPPPHYRINPTQDYINGFQRIYPLNSFPLFLSATNAIITQQAEPCAATTDAPRTPAPPRVRP